MRRLIVGVALATMVSASAPALAAKPGEREDYNRYYDQNGNYSGPSWRGSDGRMYCRKRDGTTGLIVGAAAGALIGRAIDRRGDRTVGTVVGGVAGALVGREVERSASRCE
ncbi:MAG TPA: glycine zipper 2TM domain-containing protein [Allosphingosinicella sp.]|nr:glycine zipper 2TM domain-containing protein [Allosphingosinicella sp.]